MTDEAIEIYLKKLLAEAYPDVKENQVIIQFSDGTMNLKPRRHGTLISVGQETLTVRVIVRTVKKINRHTFIGKLGKGTVRIAEEPTLLEFQRWEYDDFVEAIQMKSVMFVISFTHEVWEAM